MRLWDMLKAENGLPVGRAFPAMWGTPRSGEAIETITGTAPLHFTSRVAGTLTDYRIYGNSYQNGVPDPEHPVEVQCVGDLVTSGVHAGEYVIPVTLQSENLFDKDDVALDYRYNDNGNWVNDPGALSSGIIAFPQTSDYIYSFSTIYGKNQGICRVNFLDENAVWIGVNKVAFNVGVGSTVLISGKTPPNTRYIRTSQYYGVEDIKLIQSITKSLYLSEPLRKQLNGDAADEINYVTQTLIRRVDENCDPLVTPTTESVTLPQIQTISGQNTLSIGTTVQPSSVSITGHIKPTGYGQLLDVNGVDIQDSNGTPIFIQG